jgi:hypothetical protein
MNRKVGLNGGQQTAQARDSPLCIDGRSEARPVADKLNYLPIWLLRHFLRWKHEHI